MLDTSIYGRLMDIYLGLVSLVNAPFGFGINNLITGTDQIVDESKYNSIMKLKLVRTVPSIFTFEAFELDYEEFMLDKKKNRGRINIKKVYNDN